MDSLLTFWYLRYLCLCLPEGIDYIPVWCICFWIYAHISYSYRESDITCCTKSIESTMMINPRLNATMSYPRFPRNSHQLDFFYLLVGYPDKPSLPTTTGRGSIRFVAVPCKCPLHASSKTFVSNSGSKKTIQKSSFHFFAHLSSLLNSKNGTKIGFEGVVKSKPFNISIPQSPDCANWALTTVHIYKGPVAQTGNGRRGSVYWVPSQTS